MLFHKKSGSTKSSNGQLMEKGNVEALCRAEKTGKIASLTFNLLTLLLTITFTLREC